MSEGPVPGPSLAGPGPFDSLVFNETPAATSTASVSDTAPNGAQGRVSGNFRFRSRDANHPHQQQQDSVSFEFGQHEPACSGQQGPSASDER